MFLSFFVQIAWVTKGPQPPLRGYVTECVHSNSVFVKIFNFGYKTSSVIIISKPISFFVEERRLKFKHWKFNSQCCSIFIGRIIVVFAVCAVSCCFSVLLSSFIDAFCATKTVYENIQYKADFFLDVVNNVMLYTVSWKPTDFCPAVSVQQPGLLNTPVLNVYLQDAEKRTPRVRIWGCISYYTRVIITLLPLHPHF